MPDWNMYRKPEERRISFGKYKGKLYSEVPKEYLEWFVNNAYWQMVNRRAWAEQELTRRMVFGAKKGEE